MQSYTVRQRFKSALYSCIQYERKRLLNDSFNVICQYVAYCLRLDIYMVSGTPTHPWKELMKNGFHLPNIKVSLISARKHLAVCDVTNVPYMEINWQSLSIYGYLVTWLAADYLCAGIYRISGIIQFYKL